MEKFPEAPCILDKTGERDCWRAAPRYCSELPARVSLSIVATGAGPATGFQFGLNEAGIEQTLVVKTGWSAATLPVNRFILKRE